MIRKSAYETMSLAVWRLFLILGTMYVVPAYAQVGSAQEIMNNIAQAVPNLMQLVTAVAYVMGMAMIIAGVIKLKHLGEARTQMSHEHSLAGPLAMLVTGTMLLYLPSAVQVGMSTFWTNPNPYGYETTSGDQWAQFISVCFSIVQLFGTIAFIRGLLILSRLGTGGHQGGMGKGVTHLVAGILCINIYGVAQVVMLTLGFQS